MISLRFIACVVLYGSLCGAGFIANDVIDGQSHSMVEWATLFGKPFLSALGIAVAVILFLSSAGSRARWR